MKQEFTMAELAAQLTALGQVFDKVELADARMGVLDPATLQPIGKIAEVPMLDDAGRGVQLTQTPEGPGLIIAQGIQVEGRPCVILMHCGMPHSTRTQGAENSFLRTVSQMQDDLRRDYVTGVYNGAYLNEEYRRRAEQAALQGTPVGAVMVRINEYWHLREHESLNAAGCCLNTAAGILQLAVGTDTSKAVLARLNDGFFAIITIGQTGAAMANTVREAMEDSRKEFNISLARRGSFTVEVASAEWGETASWDMLLSLAQQRL